MPYINEDNIWNGLNKNTVNFIKSEIIVKKPICSQCGEKFIRYMGEIDYIQKIGNRKYEFCSWTCKCRFKREHAKEIENSQIDSYEKFLINQRKTAEARKKPTTERCYKEGWEVYVDDVKYKGMNKASIAVYGYPHTIASIKRKIGKMEFDYKGHHIKIIKPKGKKDE